jgi:hypothetical protein
MKVSLNRILYSVQSAIEDNIGHLNDVVASDSDLSDELADTQTAFENLESAMTEFIDSFDECNTLRPSLGRTNIEIRAANPLWPKTNGPTS